MVMWGLFYWAHIHSQSSWVLFYSVLGQRKKTFLWALYDYVNTCLWLCSLDNNMTWKAPPYCSLWPWNNLIHETCAAKMCLYRSLSLSYQKQDWWAGPHLSLFCYDTVYRFVICSHYRLCCKVGGIPKEGFAEPRLPILLLVFIFLISEIIMSMLTYSSFGMTTTRTLKDAFCGMWSRNNP